MDAVDFLEQWKRFRKEEHRTNCIICKNRDRSIKKRGMCVCNSEENLVDCMIRNIGIVENWAKTHPVIILTEQQKTAIRGRIAEGYRWVVGWQFSNVVFSVEKPEQNENGGIGLRGRISYGDFLFFNFAKGNSIFYLPDLLRGEE